MDDLIEMNCPLCNFPLAFYSKGAGQKGKCPDCNAHFTSPTRNSRSQSIHVIDSSNLPSPKHRPKSYCHPCSDRASVENPLDMFCPTCHKLLTFNYDDVWNKGMCPDCGATFTIFEPDHIARYFAGVKSGSVDTVDNDDYCSSDDYMNDPPITVTNDKHHFLFSTLFDSFIDFIKMYFTLFGIVLVAEFILYGLISDLALSLGFIRREEPTLWSFVGFTSGLGILVSLYFLFATLIVPLSEDSYHRDPIDWGSVFISCSSFVLSILLTFLCFYFVAST